MSSTRGLAKAGLYFSAAGTGLEGLQAEMEQAASALLADLPPGTDLRIGRRLAGYAPLPHEVLMADSPAPFDYVFEASGGGDEAAGEPLQIAIAAMARALGTRIDRKTAAVFVGTEIAITAGDGPVFVVMPLRRVPSLSHGDFMDQWFGRHAALGEKVEGVRYRQNHVDAISTADLAGRIGLSFAPMDGLTESYFDGLDDALAILSREDVAVGAIEDEKRFIHHPASQFALYETLWRS
ncbi:MULTISPECIES: EthD domain-containing protein [Novosphingobium]|uniref:EthD domain-containing protein n=1 Tax=Novosphingobium mathurense TaxID=428990 RepID=A0A1U6HV29_9SPHN|nr:MULTISPECIES: EthD domain-containing protein [Novosphingobium]CDO35125.1 hypothetical protein SPHV1_220010 [Novosphingobium sp. KN65.2]SLJ99662.1 EthD domain-containing protein [Novosphingobium mathurense]